MNRALRGRHTPHRHKASFGKRSKFFAMAELLCRGREVDATVVDRGIDYIVRLASSPYVDVQSKARFRGTPSRTTGRQHKSRRAA
jgi:hypothetical protein